ncbi:MAG: hypothetical protein ABI042_19550 [Verrucomicrobiota bacterium]
MNIRVFVFPSAQCVSFSVFTGKALRIKRQLRPLEMFYPPPQGGLPVANKNLIDRRKTSPWEFSVTIFRGLKSPGNNAVEKIIE